MYSKVVGLFVVIFYIETININAVPALVEAGSGDGENRGCGRADIVFVLDESNSISHDDFDRGKNFIAGVIGHLNVGPEANRIGMISFGETAGVRFDMNQFTNRGQLQDHVLALKRFSGTTTGTYHALRLLRTSLYDETFGARKQVSKIGVLITDGGSTIPQRTEKQAKLVHQAGILVFAIGVATDVQALNETELHIIASDPDERFSFRVDDWVALQSIRQAVASRACEVANATLAPPPVVPEGGKKNNCLRTDIIFVPSDSAGPIQLNCIARFIKDVTLSLDIVKGYFRIGVLATKCRGWDGFDLDDYNNVEHMTSKTDQWHIEAPDTARLLGELRWKMALSHGGNDTVPLDQIRKVGVFFIDHKSVDVLKTIEQARKAHDEGIEIFIIAVGTHYNTIEVASMASLKLSDHVMRINSYRLLEGRLKALVEALQKCPECD